MKVFKTPDKYPSGHPAGLTVSKKSVKGKSISKRATSSAIKSVAASTKTMHKESTHTIKGTPARRIKSK